MLTARHPDYSEKTDSPATPLGSVDDLARQASRVGNIIQNFLERCQGNESSVEPEPPHLTGYVADLDRLSKYLDRAEKLANDLGCIG